MENLVNSSPLILVLVFLVIGFVFLMKGADFFVTRPAEKILSDILLLHKKDPCMPCCNKI